MCSNRWLLKNEGNPSFILKYLEKFKISTLMKKCPGFPGNSWQKEPAPKKKGSDPKNTNLQFTPPNATNMEVNLRIVHFVNVENIFFFFATVKGGGVRSDRQPLLEKRAWVRSEAPLADFATISSLPACVGWSNTNWDIVGIRMHDVTTDRRNILLGMGPGLVVQQLDMSQHADSTIKQMNFEHEKCLWHGFIGCPGCPKLGIPQFAAINRWFQRTNIGISLGAYLPPKRHAYRQQ